MARRTVVTNGHDLHVKLHNYIYPTNPVCLNDISSDVELFNRFVRLFCVRSHRLLV